jgi:signal transduction histidine kinase
MTSHAVPSERIIAGARLVLAISAIGLGLVYQEQYGPAGEPVYPTLLLYFIYSLMVVTVVDRSLMRPERLAFATQLADTLWFSLILVRTQGDHSPFFLFYVFSLITASFRWGFRGTLFVNTANVGMYLVVYLMTTRSEFNFHAFMVRPVYLYVLACLIGYLAEHQKKSQRRLVWLAEMSGSLQVRSRFTRMLDDAMNRVREFFRAEQCILVMEEDENGKIAVRKAGKGIRSGPYQLSGMSSDELEFLLAPRGNIGYVVNPHKWVARVFGLKDVMSYDFETQRVVWDGFHPDLRLSNLFETESLLSVPIYLGGTFRGRLYLVNRRSENFSILELQFLRLIVSQVAPLLDNFRLLQNMQKLSVLEEKSRIARDLHDGLLQSLAGLDLRLAACRRVFQQASPELLMELEGLQRVVRDEHMQLRNYMKHLKTPSFGENEFADALRTHVRNFERDSGVKVQLTLPARGLKLSRSANREIYQIIQEALANVRKHSAASQVTIRIEQDDKMMQLHVIDNGRGFSGESGGHTESLQKKPWSIAERTRALSGHLTVESRPGQGTTLTVLIPIVPPNQAFRARLR